VGPARAFKTCPYEDHSIARLRDPCGTRRVVCGMRRVVPIEIRKRPKAIATRRSQMAKPKDNAPTAKDRRLVERQYPAIVRVHKLCIRERRPSWYQILLGSSNAP
jgi:hypothetical protein